MRRARLTLGDRRIRIPWRWPDRPSRTRAGIRKRAEIDRAPRTRRARHAVSWPFSSRTRGPPPGMIEKTRALVFHDFRDFIMKVAISRRNSQAKKKRLLALAAPPDSKRRHP